MFTLEESRLLARMLRFVARALTLCVGGGLLWYLYHHGPALLPHLMWVPERLHRYAFR